MKTTITILLTVIISIGYSQETYLLIQDKKLTLHTRQYYLEPSKFKEFKKAITIDTTKHKEFYNWFTIGVVTDGEVVNKFGFMNDSALELGPAKKYLKVVNTYSAGEMEYRIAKIYIDSLKRNKIPYFIEPSIKKREIYKLEFEILQTLPADDTAGLTFSQKQEVFTKYYFELDKKIRTTFHDIDSTNIQVWSLMTGYVWVWIYLDKNEFAFSELEKFKFNYLIKPKIRQRQYNITILDEQ